MKGCFSEIGIY